MKCQVENKDTFVWHKEKGGIEGRERKGGIQRQITQCTFVWNGELFDNKADATIEEQLSGFTHA